MGKNGNRLARTAVLAGAVLGGISLAGKLAARFLAQRVGETEAASIGIIGGADGPTAVFVTGLQGGGMSLDGKILLNLLFLGLCILGYWKLRKKN